MAKSNSFNKKIEQLGMNPGTASNRLVKDILFKFINDAGHVCHRCGDVLTRDNYSVEHKHNWLDSHDPIGLYFDLDNIAFSHLKCNIGARRRNPLVCGTGAKYNRGCRCDPCKAARAVIRKRAYQKRKSG